MNSNLNLKFVLEAIDKITAPTKRMRENFTQNVDKIRDRFGSLQRGVSVYMRYIRMEVSSTLRSIHKFGEDVEKTGKKISGAGGFFTGRLTAPILGFGGLSIRAAGQVEQLERRITKMTGSAAQASKVLKALEDFSVFDLQDRSDAMESLMSRNYSADQAITRIKMLGEVAAGTGNRLSDMVNSYLNWRMKGKVDAGELDRLVQQRIPIVEVLAQQMGISEQAVYRLANTTGISFGQMKKAMQSMSQEGGRYANEMAEQSVMINGSWQAMLSDLKKGFADLGGDLFRRLDIGTKMREVGRIVRSVVDAFLALPEPVKNFIVYAALLVAALGPVLLIIGHLVTGFGLLTMGLAKLPGAVLITLKVFAGIGEVLMKIPALIMGVGKAFMFLGKILLTVGRFFLFNPIGLVIAFAVAAYMLIKHWSKVREFFGALWEGIKESFNVAIDWIVGKVQSLMTMVERMTSGLASIGSALTDNAVTRGFSRVFGDDPATTPAGAAGPALAAPGGKVDTGGTLTIKIDSTGRATGVSGEPNDRRTNFAVDRGLIMGAP